MAVSLSGLGPIRDTWITNAGEKFDPNIKERTVDFLRFIFRRLLVVLRVDVSWWMVLTTDELAVHQEISC
jgi:hypothetical protein